VPLDPVQKPLLLTRGERLRDHDGTDDAHSNKCSFLGMRLRTTSSVIADLWQRRHDRLRTTDIRDKPTALAEWFCQTADRINRRECVDHIIVLDEMHARRIPKSRTNYFNYVRKHRSLNKDAPVTRQIQ
jgi:hypothetical protein